MDWNRLLSDIVGAVTPILKIVGAGGVSGTAAFALVERGTPRGFAPHWKLLACTTLTGVMNWLLHAGDIFTFGSGPQGWAGVGFAALAGTATAFLLHDHGERIPIIGGAIAGVKRKPAEAAPAAGGE